MELYDKKFVYFDWDDKLEGKKGFFADNINNLKQNVINNKTSLYGEIFKNSDYDSSFPFRVMDKDGWQASLRFCYYDPDYEVKKAFMDGKTIQARYSPEKCDTDAEHDWFDIDLNRAAGGFNFNDFELRIKPEFIWHVVLSDEGTLGIAKSTNKHIYFTGDDEECKKWINEHDKFEKIMIAWEQGKAIQYNSGNGWEDCCDNKPVWVITSEYRVKDDYYEVYTSDLNCLRICSENDKPSGEHWHCFFSGTYNECKEWVIEHEKFYDVMCYWEQGKTIEAMGPDSYWHQVETPQWHTNYKYRVKADCKKVEYVPFDNLNEFITKWEGMNPGCTNRPKCAMPMIWVKSKDTGCIYLIDGYDYDYDEVGIYDSWFTLENMFKNYTFIDDSIIGKVKERGAND